MPLTSAQLNAIVARALPDERLKEWRTLVGERYALALASGERLTLHVYPTANDAANAASALRLLHGEIDLPVPQLRAADESGETVGQPYLLTAELTGEPLAQVVGRIPSEKLYDLGRRLGEVVARVHRLAAERYGRIAGGDATDERAYILARLECDLARCHAHGLLDRMTNATLRVWFADTFQPASKQIALLHGGLTPEHVLVRQTGEGWRLSGLVGWERALGWVPAWDHVVLLDAMSDARYFGLRVGYGNGYDAQTPRAYEQVRERMLTPYRLLLALEHLPDSYERGDIAQTQQRRRVVEGALRLLQRDEDRRAAT